MTLRHMWMINGSDFTPIDLQAFHVKHLHLP